MHNDLIEAKIDNAVYALGRAKEELRRGDTGSYAAYLDDAQIIITELMRQAQANA